MKKISILTYPNKILLEKAKKVEFPLASETKALIARMTEAVITAKGLGLAAPQVGQSLRLCIVLEIDETKKNGQIINTHVLINPKITAFSKKTTVMEEGCLSFPDKYFRLSRPESVKVRYLNEQGEKCKIKARGIMARTIQHEIDHLNGILLIDYMKKS